MKITCCVIGCKRWTRKFTEPTIMICGYCWKRIPPSYRKVWLRIKKQDADGTPRAERIWNRMAHIAFERSAGL